MRLSLMLSAISKSVLDTDSLNAIENFLATFNRSKASLPQASKNAFISVGLFCSTLWPCIYTLAIAGLGKHTNQGSGFLIMMIMGGGIISYLQGVVSADSLLGIQWSYLVGVACFGYLAFYAWKVTSILKSQGIDYDNQIGGGH